MAHRTSFVSALALSLAAIAACSSPAPASGPSDSDPAAVQKQAPPGPKTTITDAGAGTDMTPTTPAPGYVDAAMPLLTILPLKAFSGFDGTHTFQVPIAVYGGGSDLTLTGSDPTLAQIDPTKLDNPSGDDGTYFMVTVKGAGEVILTAKTAAQSVTAKFEITSYPAENYAVGEARYKNGEGTDPPCTQCHAGVGGIDHSPAAMGSASDGDVLRVILSGILVAGNPITQVKHKWTATDAEQKGLITYLRALPPRGFNGN